MTEPCCEKPDPNRAGDRCLTCNTNLSSKAQGNRDNGDELKLDKYSDQAPLLSLDAYKLRKKFAVDTTRAQMELVVSNLLDDIRADRVEGFVFAADMKEGHARVEAGGQMSCASALWLGQMIINKVGPQ